MIPSTPSFLAPFALSLGHLLLINEIKSIHKRSGWLLLRVVHVLVCGARITRLVIGERLEVRFWRTLWQKGEACVIVKLLLDFLSNLISLRRIVDDLLASTLRWPSLLPDLLRVSYGSNSDLTHAVPFATLATFTLPRLPALSRRVGSPIISGLVWLNRGLLCHWIVALRLLIHHHHENRVILVVVVA